MKRMIILMLAVAMMALIGGCNCMNQESKNQCQGLSHSVYFKLNDASEEKVGELVSECHKYLKEHPGVVFFAAGKLSPEHNREVNDRDFDVSITIVFDSVKSQNIYQTAPAHLEFIERNKDNWKQVRVFDSLVW